MGIEIERKYLVDGKGWQNCEGVRCRQGYLNLDKERTVRVRLIGEKAFITIKGVSRGMSRAEFEYEIPGQDAGEMFRLCDGCLIDKTRRRTIHAGMTWEVDEFHGANAGLVVAEIELESEDQTFEKPPWLGQEITNDTRYYNSNLVARPFSAWEDRVPNVISELLSSPADQARCLGDYWWPDEMEELRLCEETFPAFVAAIRKVLGEPIYEGHGPHGRHGYGGPPLPTRLSIQTGALRMAWWWKMNRLVALALTQHDAGTLLFHSVEVATVKHSIPIHLTREAAEAAAAVTPKARIIANPNGDGFLVLPLLRFSP